MLPGSLADTQVNRIALAERKLERSRLALEIAVLLRGKSCHELGEIESEVREILGVKP